MIKKPLSSSQKGTSNEMSNNFSRRHTLSLLKKSIRTMFDHSKSGVQLADLTFPSDWRCTPVWCDDGHEFAEKLSSLTIALISTRASSSELNSAQLAQGLRQVLSTVYSGIYLIHLRKIKTLCFFLRIIPPRVFCIHTRTKFERVVGRQPSYSTASDWQNCSPYIKRVLIAHTR